MKGSEAEKQEKKCKVIDQKTTATVKPPKGFPFGSEEEGVSLGSVLSKNKLSVISQKRTCGAQIHPRFRLQCLGIRQWAAGGRWRGFRGSQPLFTTKAPSCVSATSHRCLNNPFAVNGCTTHNASFVYEPPKSYLPVCPLPVHFYSDDQHNSSLQRHPNLVEKWPLSIENYGFFW